MQQERLDNYHLLIESFDRAIIPEPEKALEKIRSKYPEIHIQLLRADLIAGKEHILFAARNAIAGYGSRHRKSKGLAMELLLYISCQRQISKAINLLGVQAMDTKIVFVALAESERHLKDLASYVNSIINGKEEDGLLDICSSKKIATLKHAYEIGSIEMEAARLPGELEEDVLKRLVIERSALLTLEG